MSDEKQTEFVVRIGRMTDSDGILRWFAKCEEFSSATTGDDPAEAILQLGKVLSFIRDSKQYSLPWEHPKCLLCNQWGHRQEFKETTVDNGLFGQRQMITRFCINLPVST